VTSSISGDYHSVTLEIRINDFNCMGLTHKCVSSVESTRLQDILSYGVSFLKHQLPSHLFRIQFVAIVTVISDMYIISIHDGLTSTTPMLASVWGSADPRSPARCSNGTWVSNGTRSSHRRSQQQQLLKGTAVTGSHGFYVRFQAVVRPADNFTFVCELSPHINGKNMSPHCTCV
jgi:hypothetical protein